ncbi:hypothetical protein [Streptomyces niveus]|uniref:DUF7683 domain-containing protein n=1 Tax=Streptomyces niveus TaxID=193462 RepID=A0ABZ2ADJ9_STRNV|nr:hypothetical protein [Streptomyces niveus]WTA57606.1 hypothetical protein OG211_03455 [Streptomyces niveus]
MRFVLTAYVKGDDLPSSEIDITHLGERYLGSLAGAPAASCVDVYPVDAKKVDELGKKLNDILDPQLYDYFVEAEQE